MAAVGAAARAGEAQQAKSPRVGILSSANPRSDAIYHAFEQRLRKLGHVEGQNVGIEFRNADGRFERLTDLANELVRLNVNAIVTASPVASRAVKSATDTIPLVMLAVNYDPIALGYVKSLARPGTNVTGLFFLHRELTAKRFGLFREILPNVHQIAVLTDAQEAADQLVEVEAANRSVGAKLQNDRAARWVAKLRRSLSRRKTQPQQFSRWNHRPSSEDAVRLQRPRCKIGFRQALRFASMWRPADSSPTE